MARSKKIGGVKKPTRREETSAAVTPKPTRKIGGVKETVRGVGARVNQQQPCPDNCIGEICEGMWIHSPTCKWSSVLWRLHGKTEKEWRCPFRCEPIEIPSGWTHPYNCEFWDRTGRTPFDHNIPGGTVGVGQAYRAKNGNTDTRRLLPIDFDKFPAPIQEGIDEDDDLPF